MQACFHFSHVFLPPCWKVFSVSKKMIFENIPQKSILMFVFFCLNPLILRLLLPHLGNLLMNESTAVVKDTPLCQNHIALGARMVPFAGWNMPVQYTEGIISEHNHTREQVSLFDICHMGEFRLTGSGVAEALDKIFPRLASSQKPGSCRYNFLLTDRGTVIDDLIIYRMDEEEFYIVVNAGSKDADLARLRELLPDNIKVVDESDTTAKLDLQGPESAEVLASLGFDKAELPGYYKWIKTEIKGIPVLLSRTGYTGELGFELYFAADKAPELWDLLLENQKVKPAGLGARDTLRLEMGYPLYGHEMDTDTTPIEAGFGGMLKISEDRKFPGVDILRNAQKTKQLAGIEIEGRRAAREGAEVTIDGNIVGKVTSGTFSPSLSKAIALVYFNADVTVEMGMGVELAAGRSTINGKVTELPFYKSSSVRKEI
jgi:glycine cleavage system T protein (aminomethyltransferase)